MPAQEQGNARHAGHKKRPLPECPVKVLQNMNHVNKAGGFILWNPRDDGLAPNFRLNEYNTRFMQNHRNIRMLLPFNYGFPIESHVLL